MRRSLALLTALLLGPAAGAQPASFQGLGDLPGGMVHSTAQGVSHDGNVVVGHAYSSNGAEAFRWTEATGMVGLGDLPGGIFQSTAWGVSADGSVVVGTGENADDDPEAFRWTLGGGMEGLGSLGDFQGGGFPSEAWGVSDDGAVVVGAAGGGEMSQEAFRWTPSGGMVGLGDLPGGSSSSRATGVSADGNHVVGQGLSADGDEAFRWTAGVMIGLGALPGAFFNSRATDVSDDGAVVVGHSASDGTEAFRWTAATGMVGLGDLPGGTFHSQATAVSADGSVVVGQSIGATAFEAFVWTAADGMRPLRDVLVEQGVDMTGWALGAAWGLSPDGRVVVGIGLNPQGQWEAYRAVLSGGHRWTNPAGGSWDVASNWEPATVPGAGDAVAFDLPGAYTVTGGAALGGRSVRELGADDGTVDFSLDNLALTSTSLDLPSLTVSFDATAKIVAGTASFVHGSVGYGFNAPGDTTTTARLQVFNAGTELDGSGFLFVGGVGGGRGEVFVAAGSLRSDGAALGMFGSIGEVVVGNAGSWTVNQQLRVGFADVGRLFVEEGGAVSAGRLEMGRFTDPGVRSLVDVAGVGPAGRSRLFVADSAFVGGSGDATLRVRDGGQATAGRVLVGSESASVLVDGASGPFRSTVVANRVVVGFNGAGDLFVRDGALVELNELFVGTAGHAAGAFVGGRDGSGPVSQVIATAPNWAGRCIVGGSAAGQASTLEVADGGYVRCDGAEVGDAESGYVVLGLTFGSDPETTDILIVSRVLTIGGGAAGTLQLSPGAYVDAVDAERSPPSDLADVVVDGSGRIEGAGSIRGRLLSVGFVGPGVLVIPPAPRAGGARDAAGGAAGGTLLVEGAYAQEAGGTLEVALAGPDTTQQGRLRVRPIPGYDGSAALAGTLRLAFQNAYAPGNGDVFELLDAASATGAFGAVEVTGLEPGWPFDVSVVNGSVVVTSLGDGVPTTFPTPAEPGAPAPAALALHAPAPNPTSGATTLRFDLPASGRVRLALYDALGREVALLIDGDRPAGAHEAKLHAGALAPGVYVVRLDAGTAGAAARRVTVFR